MLGGLLGAGLIGMLMGNGFLGGLGGFASIFGLLLQVGLIVGVGFLLYRWWQRRSQPQAAYAGMPREMAEQQPRSALGGFGGSAAARPRRRAEPLEIKPEDFDTFERLLGEVQTAYGREDLAALRAHLTPEMLSYYAEELSENASRGVVNQLSDVKLLQGDLSEAWREGDKEYASVAMRYSLRRPLCRSRHRQSRRRQRCAAGSDRSVDLHACARRQLAALGDPAGVSAVQTTQTQEARQRCRASLFSAQCEDTL